MVVPTNIKKTLLNISEYCDKHKCEECMFRVGEKKTCMFEISPAYWNEILQKKN